MTVPPDLIWYVAYGSNLSWARLACYLNGGTPPGGRRANRPARDPAPPRGDVGVTLPGQVYFARSSVTWGGGVAFYDPDRPGSTLARAYLLTVEQFGDLMAQEQGRARPAPEATSRYGDVVACGERHGTPMVTLTAPWPMAEVKLRAPSLDYLATMGAGLGESHGLHVDAQAAYLAGLPGAAPRWDAGRLADALTV